MVYHHWCIAFIMGTYKKYSLGACFILIEGGGWSKVKGWLYEQNFILTFSLHFSIIYCDITRVKHSGDRAKMTRGK